MSNSDGKGRGEIGWLVGSLREREAALGMLEQAPGEPRDELGFASLRDTLSDAFFPGVTTQQTRAKYFLLVPWMYKRIEERRSSTEGSATRIKNLERRLLEGFRRGGYADGVIGSRQWRVPNRTACEIYWTGLHTWRVRLFRDSRPRYHSAVDGRRGVLRRRRSDEPTADVRENWEPELPPAPGDFLSTPRMELEKSEARFLFTRILAMPQTGRPRPLIKDLVEDESFNGDVVFWKLPAVVEHRATLWSLAKDAGYVSAAANGAMILYNRLCGALKPGAESSRERWDDELARWQTLYPSDYWAQWDRDAFWERVRALPNGVRAWTWTHRFIDDWVDFLIDGVDLPREATRGVESRPGQLLQARERRVKMPAQVRLLKASALDTWDSTAGVGRDPMTYRWGKASRIIGDIRRGLE